MFGEELSINPAKLYKSLWDAVFAQGPAELVVGEDVKLINEKSKTVQVSVDGTRVPCDIVVLTAGSWSRELCKQLHYDPQILPARGLAILFDTGGEEIITTPAVLEDYGMGLAQHNQTTLRLTGFFEMVGFQKNFSNRRKNWLLDRFRRHVVKSDRVKIVEEGVGFRPCTPDQIPIVGLVPRCQNVYIASGNCRLGVTLAPATAQIVSSMISGSFPPSKRETWYEPSRL